MKKKRRIVLLVIFVLAVSAYCTLRQVKLHRLPADVRQVLNEPQQVVVYSVVPKPARMEAFQKSPDDQTAALAGMDLFHDHRILGATELTSAKDRQRVVKVVKNAAASVFAVSAMCFDPHHGVRVTNDGHSYDFLICCECHQMECYDGEKRIALVYINGSPADLDSMLLSARSPIHQNAGEH